MAWVKISDQLPNDDQQVFVRVLSYFGEPFEAVYSEADQAFTAVLSGAVIPVYMVCRWAFAIGAELVTNGEFASETGWTLGTDQWIENNQLRMYSQDSATTQTIAGLESGKRYEIVAEVVFYDFGTVFVKIGDETMLTFSAIGEQSYQFTYYGGSKVLSFSSLTWCGMYFTSVSIKEVA